MNEVLSRLPPSHRRASHLHRPASVPRVNAQGDRVETFGAQAKAFAEAAEIRFYRTAAALAWCEAGHVNRSTERTTKWTQRHLPRSVRVCAHSVTCSASLSTRSPSGRA